MTTYYCKILSNGFRHHRKITQKKIYGVGSTYNKVFDHCELGGRETYEIELFANGYVQLTKEEYQKSLMLMELQR